MSLKTIKIEVFSFPECEELGVDQPRRCGGCTTCIRCSSTAVALTRREQEELTMIEENIELEDFIQQCFTKEWRKRPSAEELEKHPFFTGEPLFQKDDGKGGTNSMIKKRPINQFATYSAEVEENIAKAKK